MKNKNLIKIVRWIAGIIGMLFFIFVVLVAIGEGVPKFWKESLPVQLEALAMVIMLIGAAAGLKWNGWGAGLLLGGVGLFHLVEGKVPPVNVVFIPPMITGILYLFCWLMGKYHHMKPQTDAEIN
jgi:hypothetical protein